MEIARLKWKPSQVAYGNAQAGRIAMLTLAICVGCSPAPEEQLGLSCTPIVVLAAQLHVMFGDELALQMMNGVSVNSSG